MATPQVLTPKLLKLVDEEEEWLLQQEALAANSSDSEAVAATASGVGAAQPARADAGNDPGVAALAAGGSEAGVATAGAAAKACGSKRAKTRDSEEHDSKSDAGRRAARCPRPRAVSLGARLPSRRRKGGRAASRQCTLMQLLLTAAGGDLAQRARPIVRC